MSEATQDPNVQSTMSPKSERVDVEKLTLIQIMQAITLKQLAALLAVLSAALVAAFALGNNWEKRSHSIEIGSLTQKLDLAIQREKSSAAARRIAETKTSFLKLSAVLQFAAIERRIPADRSFATYPPRVPGQGFMVSDGDAADAFGAYKQLVTELLRPADGTEPLAYLERNRVPPWPLTFKDDHSKWLTMTDPSTWPRP